MNKTNMSLLIAACLMSSSVMASQTGKKQVTAVKGVPELMLEKTSYVPLHEGGLQGFAIDLFPGIEKLYVINDGRYQNVLDNIREIYPNLRLYQNPLSQKISITGDQVKLYEDEQTEQVKKFLENEQYNALENLEKLAQLLKGTTFYKKEPSLSEESDDPITTKEELLGKFRNGVLRQFEKFAGRNLADAQYPNGDLVNTFQYFSEPDWIVTSDERVFPFRSFVNSQGGYITSKTNYDGSSSRLLFCLTEEEFRTLASALEGCRVFYIDEYEDIKMTAKERLLMSHPNAKRQVLRSVFWDTHDNNQPGAFVAVLGQADLAKAVILNEFDHFQSLEEFIGNKGGSVTPKDDGILITHQAPRALTRLVIEMTQKGIYDISSK